MSKSGKDRRKDYSEKRKRKEEQFRETKLKKRKKHGH